MLFMGSTKYPDENEYDSFISKSGGASNAFTECEYTLYHFAVLPQFLEKVCMHLGANRARLFFASRCIACSSAAFLSGCVASSLVFFSKISAHFSLGAVPNKIRV